MKEHGITWADHITNPAIHKTKSIQRDEEEDEHVTDLDEQDDSDESIYQVRDFATKR